MYDAGMIEKPNPSEAKTIRLRAAHWTKLRALMQHHQNRQWLEKAIERAYAKIGLTK